ncbi:MULTISPECIES: hypothetical protein [Crateriforma]|uniref:Uncharacterized protein n=1 Tax=Crateriforma conspicua TaxID=2527996 RepID=A0A5C6FRX5_9PLAN|nr:MULTISPECIES: hypothetical protein [Crateriforma]QDV61366.1 hypothetical protein Mal65_04890 [Crateriforma conspicua]TWT72381.1 hypothetical protein Pan14r_47010 [Crateriforma conspicua]TWU63246.1 hypothetical protein V7x_49860 [Crateriforma conspicua]
MTKRILFAVAVLGGLFATSGSAQAGDPYGMTHIWKMNQAANRPWHGAYQYQQYGQPTALVVPPTAHMRQTYSWGVSQNLMYPLNHQFGRSASYPGAAAPGQFLNTPNWPSHTDQFGIYYVRGPWR